MKEITASKLTKMLIHGFEGKADFEGFVFGEIKLEEGYRRFYEANGKISLCCEENAYSMGNLGSLFYFRMERSGQVIHTTEEGTDRIIFPIDLTKDAVLRIEPRNIFY